MATDHMHGIDAVRLLGWILEDLEQGSALGIVKELFFSPRKDDPFRMERYGVTLESPLGVAAGPHTQMAQNIIAAWLCGARYIELKTVQVLDQITVSKPCIDMADEGYNCEWSQELSLDQSYEEYLKAWVLLHILHDRLGGVGQPGMIFNMSAGYSMEGILSPSVQRFLDRMRNCGADVEALKKQLAGVYPQVAKLSIPGSMSDNLTISCMHGCPPAEVEKIALYFLRERKLHTTLKMNPTLLGPQRVRGILNETLGYDIEVPDIAFEHDLPYDKAIGILKNCRQAAEELHLRFSVKLTNTLETTNSGKSLPENEKMVYMSGRSLHPISIALAERLQKDFSGDLDISFCAGVDSLNVADTLACGLAPVTVCSDLLKPGGYGRLAQYIGNIRESMSQAKAASLEDFVRGKAGIQDYKAAVVKNLEAYAAQAASGSGRYAKTAVKHADVKTARVLPALDCAAAPCMSMCPVGQNIPAYLERVAAGDMDGSLAVILASNPFPNVLGAMCNQACREKCMRNQYDEPLRIRDIKGCAADGGSFTPARAASSGRKTAVVGAGPAGLSCAFFLALAGCAVEVFEADAAPGGRILGPMLAKKGKSAEHVEKDLAVIRSLGVNIRTGQAVDGPKLRELVHSFDAVYTATGEAVISSPDAANLFRQPREGVSSLVGRVGEGRRAASSILAHLGLLLPDNRKNSRGGINTASLRVRQAYRKPCPAKQLDAKTAGEEASRCLQCDLFCGICVSVCPNRANVLLASAPRNWPVQQAEQNGAGVRVATIAQGGMEQSRQVINIGDFCNECGNCAAFCPSSGAPYRDKRRLHLSKASFDADNNGFWREGAGRFLGKNQGQRWTLQTTDKGFLYEDEFISAVLDRHSLAASTVVLKNGCNAASLVPAVEAALFCSLVADNPALASVDGLQSQGARS